MATVSVERSMSLARRLPRDLVLGVISGQFAGLLMLGLLMIVFTVFLDRPAWYPVQVIGSLAFGEAALGGFHPPAFMAGIVLHLFGPCLFWGLVYGVLVNIVRPLRVEMWEIIGLVVGAFMQVIDVYVFVPAVFHIFQGYNLWQASVPDGWSWAAHLMFGVALTLVPFPETRLARPRPPRTPRIVP